ncbi:MAG: 3-dehydroquinate synthase, partial [Gammaproteobacteria bacterium]|nr:3-dehydroquinate synthase [Gammaproteobacteria bacterium]
EELGVEQLRAHMRHDKKNVGGRQRFILMRAIGQAEVTDQVDERLLSATLAGVR